MENKILSLLDSLTGYLRSKDSDKALKIITNISQCFDDRFTSNKFGFYIEKVITDLLSFLRSTLQCQKIFRNANAAIFDLFMKLMGMDDKELRTYSNQLLEISLEYINSTSFAVTAREKEKSVLLVQKMVETKIISNDDLLTLTLNNLLTAVILSKDQKRYVQYSLQLFGLISRHYPVCISSNESVSIFKMFWQKIEEFLNNQNDTSLIVAAGAINGLSNYMYSFKGNLDCEQIKRTYDHLKNFADPSESRYRACYRDAMNLITEHGELFRIHLKSDFLYWHEKLAKWLHLSDSNDRITGFKAIQAFHHIIFSLILEDDNDKNMLEFFIKYFIKTLHKRDAKPFEIRIAINGCGEIIAPIKQHKPQCVDEMLALIIQRTELMGNLKDRQQLEHIPNFCQAISKILQQVDFISEVQLNSLRNIMIGLIKDFYYLSSHHHKIVQLCVLNSCRNLMLLNEALFENFLQSIIFHGLIWSCSHKWVVEADWSDPDWKENVTYRKFLPFWKGLLADNNTSDDTFYDVQHHIYKQIIQSVLLVLDKLDLSVKKTVYTDDSGTDQILCFTDPNDEYALNKPKDYHLFLNIIDLIMEVLYPVSERQHERTLIPLVNEFCEKMITKTEQYPLLSGFPKLLTFIVKILEKVNYFEGNSNSILNMLSCFIIRNLINVDQFNGELQIVYFRLFFACPVTIVAPLALKPCNGFIKMLQIAFDIGKSIISLAHEALSAIIKITEYVRVTRDVWDLEPFFADVLPHLDSFLKNRSYTDDAASMKKDMNVVKNRKFTSRKWRVEQGSETELSIFQSSVLKFLGSLDPELSLLLIEPNINSIDYDLVKWGKGDVIRMILRFQDVEPAIYLDNFLPRVSYLSLHSTDRVIKLAACEFLHAVILYILGTDNFQDEIWRKLANQMITLSCDTDMAVQQMFEPLLMESMRFFANRSKIHTSGAEIMIDEIFFSITNKQNASVRDLAARSLRELCRWAIQESVSSGPDQINTTIDLILDKLRLYSFDADPFKRYGAAIAFNNLYQILREDERIINKYWINLLYTFLVNLKQSEELLPSVGQRTDLDVILSSLDHVVRVLIEKKEIFNSISTFRIRVSVMEEPDLLNCTKWLFKELGSIQKIYRSKIMKLLVQIGNAVSDVNNLISFISTYFSGREILDIFENNKATGVQSLLKSINSNENISKMQQLQLLKSICCTMECYIWLIEVGLFAEYKTVIAESCVFQVLNLNINLFIRKNDSHQYSMNYEEIGNQLLFWENEFIMSTLKFIEIMLRNDIKWIPLSFWVSDSQVKLLIKDLILPNNSQGLCKFDYQGVNRIRRILEKCLPLLLEKAPKDFLNMLIRDVINDMMVHLENITDIHTQLSSMPTTNLNLIKGFTLILNHINELNLSIDEQNKLKISCKNILLVLFHSMKKEICQNGIVVLYAVEIDSNSLYYLKNLLKMCLSFNDFLIDVCHLILDETNLLTSNGNTNNTIAHGYQFIKTFNDIIYEYLLKDSYQCIEIMVNQLNVYNCFNLLFVLLHFIEYAENSKKTESFDPITNAIINNWNKIYNTLLNSTYNGSDKSLKHLQLIEVILKLITINPEAVNTIGKRIIGFQDWILNLITNDNAVELKIRAIYLLPCLIGPNDDVDEAIESALLSIQKLYIPMRSSDFPVESIERTSLIAINKALLKALNISRSPLLLKFLINTTSAEQKHVMEHDIVLGLETLIRYTSSDNHINLLQMAFNIFLKPEIHHKTKITVLKRFLLSMLRVAKENSIIEFYTTNMKVIIDLLDAAYNYSNEKSTTSTLAGRIGGYNLIEYLFASINPDFIKGKCENSKLYQAINAITKIGKDEFLKFIIQKTFRVRTENFLSQNKELMECYRLYQCASYQALASILSNTMTQLQRFENFLFIEKPSSNAWIWKNIINTWDDDMYIFNGQEFESYPKQKDRITSIRRLHFDNKPSREGLIMQNIFESSVGQDLEKIDFNNVNLRTVEETESIMLDNKNCIRLEKMSVNEHELMPVLCAVIQYLFDANITPLPEKRDTIHRATPIWVNAICETISSRYTHRNIRIFLAKLIENCKDIFKFYANAVTSAILNVIVDRCGGTTLNIFDTDLTVMLLEWTTAVNYEPSSSEEIHLMSRLLELFVSNCFHLRIDIFKFNLEIIKKMIELWKNCQVPYTVLFDAINFDQSSDSTILIRGIQVNAVFLVNGFYPWMDFNYLEYLNQIKNCMIKGTHKTYRSAAEIMGMCIATSTSGYENIVSELIDELKKLCWDNERKFLDIIYGVHLNYPPILEPFLLVITKNMQYATGGVKRLYMEIIMNGCHLFGNELFNELWLLGYKDLLTSNDYQILALHTINRSISFMKPNEVERVVPCLYDLLKSTNKLCRQLVYEIMIHVRSNVQLKDSIVNRISVELLNGLFDLDVDISNRLVAYWTKEVKLPMKASELIIELFRNHYFPENEERFLNYFAQLMLQATIDNPGSKHSIRCNLNIEDNGEELKYQEYYINTNVSYQNSSFVAPLFFKTKEFKRTIGGFSINNNLSLCDEPELEFEPTLDPARMTPNSQFSMPSSSSFIFDVAPKTLDARSNLLATQSIDSSTNNLLRLRSRFVKDTKKISNTTVSGTTTYFNRRSKIRELPNKRDDIKLYRRYRIGKYPDVLINNLALLLPLRALLKEDPVLARRFFGNILSAIIKELQVEFVYEISREIPRILESTYKYDCFLIGAIMEIAIKYPTLVHISPFRISEIAINGNLPVLGILMLESKLEVGDFSECGPSKSTIESTDDETSLWIEITKIYRLLSEKDIITEIYSHILRIDPRLTNAIDLELSGDYCNALAQYKTILTSYSETRTDFINENFLDCLTQMCDWDNLSTEITNRLDDIDDLWSNDWNKSILLPLYMKSETMKLIDVEPSAEVFAGLIDNWIKDSWKSEYMFKHFPEELMILEIASGEINASRMHCEEYFATFIDEWSKLDILSKSLRRQHLLNISTLMKIYSQTGLIFEIEGDRKFKSILPKRLSSQSLTSMEWVKLWDTLISYHRFILNFMTDEDGNILKMINALDQDLFIAGLKIKNFTLAKRVQSRFQLQTETASNSLLTLQSKLNNFQLKFTNLKLNKIDMHLTIKKLRGLNAEIKSEILEDTNVTDSIKATTLIFRGEIYQEIYLLLKVHRNLIEDLSNSSSSDTEFANSYITECRGKIVSCLKNSISLVETNMNTASSIVDVYVKLAEFLGNEIQDDTLVKEEYEIFIKSVLRGISLGSNELLLMIPQLLNLSILGEESIFDVFNKEIESFPLWIFMDWLPQLLSCFNFAESNYLDNLLILLTKLFPSQLFFHFNYAYTKYLTTSKNTTIRPAINTILIHLKNPFMEKFIKAIKCICLPEVKLYAALDSLKKNIESNLIQQNSIINELELILTPDENELYGPEYSCLDKYLPQLSALKEVFLNRGLESFLKEYKDILNIINNDINNSSGRKSKTINLEKLCPWMANYFWQGGDVYIEIPKSKKTIFSRNSIDLIKIIKFGPDLNIIRSLRKPLQIKFMASDGRTYHYMVKSGENLCQDERIQQLLNVMSGLLNFDPRCKKHNIQITTYKVIPITPLCGLIEWLPNYQTMEIFVRKSKIYQDQEASLSFLGQQLIGLLKQDSDEESINIDILYGNAIKNFSNNQLKNIFKQIEYKVKGKPLKDALYSISDSLEKYWALQNNFIKSVAVLSISHWILGIGDRHLGNMMIHLSSGHIAGIDFGFAFGTKTVKSTIPELIPFRLTPQMVHVMGPLKTFGSFNKIAENCLRVYKYHRRILIECLKTFSQDPIEDCYQILDSQNSDQCWNHNSRMNIIEKKLNGFNPAHITAIELESGILNTTSKKYNGFLADYQRILSGDSQFNIRAQLSNDNLSINNQVACLIDLATDPVIFAATYVGWKPWF